MVYSMKLLLLFILLSAPVFSKTHILGYPKSGNNLFCFALSKILNEKIWMINPNASLQVWFSPSPDAASTHSFLFSHTPSLLDLDKADQDRDHLIVIVRNYREALIRFATETDAPLTPEKIVASLFRSLHAPSIEYDYFNVLKCYDNWNPKTRILIYYEDLLTDFESTMADCLMKLGVQKGQFDEFVAHKEELFKQCKDSYRYGKTMSGGDLAYHQKAWLTLEAARRLDLLVQQKFPYYWNQYLQRYGI